MFSQRQYSASHISQPYCNTQYQNKTPNKYDKLSPHQKNLYDQDCQTHYNQFSQKHFPKTPQKSPFRACKPFSTPFVSVYGRQTRLDHIMKIKVKPTASNKKQYHLSINQKEKSQLAAKKEEKTRLDQIMALKVNKPKIASTLTNYQPKIIKRQHNPQEQTRNQEEQTLFQAQLKYQKMLELQQKEDKKWKNQQKQRQAQLKQKIKQQEKQNQDQRRKQILFENMVQKELKKIQKQRELSQRRNGGFAIYVYSCY